jgi:ABC-2 type transport system ATP-binding protein
VPALSAEREATLLQSREIQTSDAELAKKELIEANLGLVVSIAEDYRVSGVYILDLIKTGNRGLIKAVDTFTVGRGYRLSTYIVVYGHEALAGGSLKAAFDITKLYGIVSLWAEVVAPRSHVQMIRVENLSKRFGAVCAVDDISFGVGRGEIFAFLGPNGAGKTTTIKMLTTLLTPTSGVLEIDGLDPRRQSNEVRKRFGIVFQDPSLDGELTAAENMELHGIFYHVPRKLRLQRTEQLLRLFELWDRSKEQVKLFSGGMKRRLEIARGLLHTPKILFLDEPTLGLDPQTRNQLWNHVKHLNQTEGVTVFLTTHYMDEAERVAQRIAIIDHGKIVAQGSPQELKTNTNTDSLEGAFLALTGSTVRDEAASSTDRLRQTLKLWGNRR